VPSSPVSDKGIKKHAVIVNDEKSETASPEADESQHADNSVQQYEGGSSDEDWEQQKDEEDKPKTVTSPVKP